MKRTSSRRAIASVVDYVLPPVLADLARLSLRVCSDLPSIGALRRNRRLDLHLQDEVYVLANGPSLNNFDHRLLRGRQVIVMNHFELAPWKDTVEIVAHCIGEPASSPAWEDPSPSILGTEAASYWLHLSARAAVERASLPASKRLHYVLPAVPPGLWAGKRVDLASPVLAYQTTAQLAMLVAMHLGYRTMYLLGFDHDWLCTRGYSPHFYEEREGVAPADLSKFSYLEMIRISERMWTIYYALRRSAEASGVRIVNLSDPSFLDVFERADPRRHAGTRASGEAAGGGHAAKAP